MSFQFYTVLHLLGVVLLFASLGGLAVHAAVGADKEAGGSVRRTLVIGHGIALVVLLVAGFGILGKKYPGAAWGGWLVGKLAIWLVLGAALALFKRRPRAAVPLFFGAVLLGATSAWLAVYKPF